MEILITEQEQAYLNTWMNKVSRSFALVVPSLEEPLNHYMATAYLICRVVDNIEDCTQSFAWKRARFSEINLLLNDPAANAGIFDVWTQLHWPGLTDDETQIMGEEDGLPLWQIYAKIPDDSRASIRRWAAVMAQGMGDIDDPDQPPILVSHSGISVLAAASDYNRYCYYVAGTVGYMATELAIHHYQLSAPVSSRLRDTCEACGRGLQKTNILKDFTKDLERSVSYLPESWHQEAQFAPLTLSGAPLSWKFMVIDDILEELRVATEYVLTLPYEASGYRMASLLSLLPAYQTILLAAKRRNDLFTQRHQVKISRPTMAKCKWDARSLLNDNAAIERYSLRLDAEIRAYFDQAE